MATKTANGMYLAPSELAAYMLNTLHDTFEQYQRALKTAQGRIANELERLDKGSRPLGLGDQAFGDVTRYHQKFEALLMSTQAVLGTEDDDLIDLACSTNGREIIWFTH